MNYTIGKKYLITPDDWFLAPDGRMYRAVFGTIQGFHNSFETLGIKVNSRSADWYMSIGDDTTMSIAGCRIHYAIRTDNCNFQSGNCSEGSNDCQIFNADKPIVEKYRGYNYTNVVLDSMEP